MIKNPLITILVLFCISLVVTTCGNKSKIKETKNVSTPTNNNSLSNRVVIVYNAILPDSFKFVLEKTVNDYDFKYKLRDTLFINDTIIQPTKIPGGHIEIIRAIGIPRNIYINRKGLTRLFNKLHFRNVVAHELFHTLRPENPTDILPFNFRENISVVSYSGLIINMKSDSNSTNINSFIFTKIEEAAAEYCAYALYDDFSHNHDGYNNVCNLMIKIVNVTKLTSMDLTECTKTNNLPKICRLMLNKKEINNSNIIRVAAKFDYVWEKGI